MQLWQHLLMQNARNGNALRAYAIKDNMPAAFHAAQAWTNAFTYTADHGRFCKLPAERPQTVDIIHCLPGSPPVARVIRNLVKVPLCEAREFVAAHVQRVRLSL